MLNETFSVIFQHCVSAAMNLLLFLYLWVDLEGIFCPSSTRMMKSIERTAHKESLCMHNFCRDQQPQKSPLYDWYKYGVEGGFEGKSREKNRRSHAEHFTPHYFDDPGYSPPTKLLLKELFLGLGHIKVHLHYSDTSKSYKWELSSYIGNHSIHENVSISSCQMFK